ncbi:MAG: hypothetical protein LBQ61_10400 [Spirochaetales bacterium]|jgi:hypothetical protein|nr:hypothetical protein [Spirochaetales bacterium]
MKPFFAALLLGVLPALFPGPGTELSARQFFLSQWGAYLDMPQGWEPLESEETRVTFSGSGAYLQIKTYAADRFATAEDIAVFAMNELTADAEGEEFTYLGEEAMFFTFLFALGGEPFEGYGLTLNSGDYDWIVLSFAPASRLAALNPFLLSALDSFSPDARGLLSPGPVSRYYQASYGPEELIPAQVDFRGLRLNLELERFAQESSEAVIQREAEVLNHYSPQDGDAWSRFYRMIYRDVYRKVDPLYRALVLAGMRPPEAPGDIARELLAFIQGFEYDRTWNLADFASPQEALLTGQGDCDSLAIFYVILLKHYGIDGIIMVSSRFSHALAAVDVEGPGARFPFEEKRYLVAETTADVELGLIESSMSAVEGWLGVSFFP